MKKEAVKLNDNDSELGNISAIIESLCADAGLIVVTSATSTDDTQPVARGISSALSSIGKRAAYLYLGLPTRSSHDGKANYVELSLAQAKNPRLGLDQSLPSWRSEYDIIIVEIPTFDQCALSAHVARIANGVVIAVHPDRRISAADRDLRTLLSQIDSKILGVVLTTAIEELKQEAKPSPVESVRAFLFPARQQ